MFKFWTKCGRLLLLDLLLSLSLSLGTIPEVFYEWPHTLTYWIHKHIIYRYSCIDYNVYIPFIKITAAQNEVTLSYHRVRGLYFLAVIFATTVVSCTVDIAHCIVYNVQCSEQFTLYIAHCTVYTVHSTVYNVQYSVYWTLNTEQYRANFWRCCTHYSIYEVPCTICFANINTR